MKKKTFSGRTGCLIIALVMLLLIICVFVLPLVFRDKKSQPAIDITGVTADGQTQFTLSENEGKIGTVLIFFNHNTGKAIETMQMLSELAPNYNVDVVAVATGSGTIEEQLAIMKEHEITVFPHTLFDLEGKMAKAYNVKGTPVTYFIDKNGLVVDAFISTISEKSMKKNLSAIA